MLLEYLYVAPHPGATWLTPPGSRTVDSTHTPPPATSGPACGQLHSMHTASNGACQNVVPTYSDSPWTIVGLSSYQTIPARVSVDVL